MAGQMEKFGQWEVNSGGTTPDTEVFDIARAGKGAKEISSNKVMPVARARYVSPMARARQERKQYEDEGDMYKEDTSPGSAHSAPASRPRPGGGRGAPAGGILRASSADAPQRRGQYEKDDSSNPSSGEGGGLQPDRPTMQKARAARAAGGRGSAVDDGSLKTRAGSTKPEEAFQNGGSGHLPKFGDWNVQDPESGPSYTVLFNNASKVKQNGGSVRVTPRQPGSPARTGDLYHTPSGRKLPKQNKLLCCITASTAE